MAIDPTVGWTVRFVYSPDGRVAKDLFFYLPDGRVNNVLFFYLPVHRVIEYYFSIHPMIVYIFSCKEFNKAVCSAFYLNENQQIIPR